MFTVFSLIGSTELLTAKEEGAIWRFVDAFAATPAGMWLNELDYRRKFAILWCRKMSIQNGTMGCFSLFLPGRIYIMPPASGGTEYWHEVIAPTVIHELRHAWQRKRMGWRYIISAIPGIRQFTIEKDADAVTEDAEAFCDDLAASDAVSKYEERITRPC